MLSKKADYIQQQVDENKQMQSEEVLSFNHEFYIAKQKCDKFKNEI